MIRRPPRSTLSSSSAASDVYKRQIKKELLSLMQKAVKLEVEKNGNEASRYCPVILHQPKRPKKLK